MATTILPTTDDSDHNMVMMRLADVSSAMLLPEPPIKPQARPRRLRVPAKNHQLLEFKAKATAQISEQAMLLKERLQLALRASDPRETDEMEAVAADFHGLLTTEILELAFATMDHEPEGVPTIGRHIPRKHMREMQSLIRTAQTLRRCSEDWRAAKEYPTEAGFLQCLEKARQKCVDRLHDVCLPQGALPPLVDLIARS